MINTIKKTEMVVKLTKKYRVPAWFNFLRKEVR